MSVLHFSLEAQTASSSARAGRIVLSRPSRITRSDSTPDASKPLHTQTTTVEVETPVFMPVGTQASVRGLHPASLWDCGSRILLSNTYHLMLRPGEEVFRNLGGIHRLMRWDGLSLTDSGGFQIFSLPNSRTIDEDGACFKSYVDGREHILSPERSIQVQHAIGSDIMMVLDQCIPSTSSHDHTRHALERTTRWARRCLLERERLGKLHPQSRTQALFGIVQGACHPDLRTMSAQALCEMDFDGMAIGGLAVGESKAEREDICAHTAALLPTDKPRYLMGVGTPIDLLEAVDRGVDMFDCILPVALAHRGVAFTSLGKLQLRRSVYRLDQRPVDPACACPCCAQFSRAYVHHLIKSDEHFGGNLLALHNLSFYHNLMKDMRKQILAGTFASWKRSMAQSLVLEDEEHPAKPTSSGRGRKAQRKSRLGDFELVDSGQGWFSIRQLSSGEVMHALRPPHEESRELYVDQICLDKVLDNAAHSRTEHDEPVVIWDVGLGAASNAMAAIRCAETREHSRPLRIYSFEQDLNALSLALREASRIPHMQHSAPSRLLKNGSWESSDGRILWQLVEGDFRSTWKTLEIVAHPDKRWEQSILPHYIYWDPFSPKSADALWDHELFSQLWTYCQQSDCCLISYSASNAVRSVLLASGWWVARGAATPPKKETTLAFSRNPLGPSKGINTQQHYAIPQLETKLLGKDWLLTHARSHSPWPEGLDSAKASLLEARLQAHPQFQT